MILPHYLREGLAIVFVGYNPGQRSAGLGHYYAGIGNAFWPCLYQSGLVPEPLTFADDHRLLDFDFGLTDLVKRPTRSAADLTAAEVRQGALALRQKLLRYRPRIVCFNGKGAYERFVGHPCPLGLQPERLGDSLVFVLPSTSARAGGLRRVNKLHYFYQLKALLDSLRLKPEGGKDMAAKLSPGVRKLFQEANFAYLSTLMPDGSPHVSPMWVDIDGDYILMDTAEGRVKLSNIRRDPRVAVAVANGQNPYSYATIRGRVVEVTHDGADELIDRLAKKYIGQDRYPWRQPGEVRVLLRIEPERVAGQMLD